MRDVEILSKYFAGDDSLYDKAKEICERLNSKQQPEEQKSPQSLNEKAQAAVDEIVEKCVKGIFSFDSPDTRFIRDRVKSAIEEATKELNAQLKSLVVNCAEKHWKQESPNFEPFEDSQGLFSQISNMLSGMVNKSIVVNLQSQLTAERERVKELEQSCLRYNKAVAQVLSDGAWNSTNSEQFIDAQQKGAQSIRILLQQERLNAIAKQKGKKV